VWVYSTLERREPGSFVMKPSVNCQFHCTPSTQGGCAVRKCNYLPPASEKGLACKRVLQDADDGKNACVSGLDRECKGGYVYLVRTIDRHVM